MIKLKKIIVIVLLIITLLFLSLDDENKIIDRQVQGVYISYIDYSNLIDKDEETSKKIIDEMVENVNSLKLNTIVLQVRPFADAIYYSKIFPISKCVSSDGSIPFDILKYFIDKSKEYKIDIYAWINPFRISSSDDINNNFFLEAWKDTDNYEITESGSYLNPSKKEVMSLITSGVAELINNYEISGILLDDYFYPNQTIDLNSFSKYKSNNNDEITIEQYRLNNIKELIAKIYKKIKEIDNTKKLILAPSGNIENNLNEEYLDVPTILKDDNYLDYVSPQLYYGFNNTNKPYLDTLNTWNNLIENDAKLLPSLALYKSGLTDDYAKDGSDEWIYNSDIIKRQIIAAKTMSNYYGFLIYRYDYLFKDEKNDNLSQEINNIKELIAK